MISKPLITKGLFLMVPLLGLVIWLSGALHDKTQPGNTFPAENAPPANVKVAVIGASLDGRTMGIDGVIKGMETVQMTAKIPAQVTAINVQEGQRVSPGTLLVTLDSRDLAAQRNQTAATVDTYRAGLQSARANLASNESTVANARTTWERTRKLFEAGAVSASERDTAKTALDNAEATFAASTAAIEQAQANVKAVEAQLENAGVQVGYTQITAPFNAIVSKKMVEVGTMAVGSAAMAGTPLITLEKTPLALHVEMDERMVSLLKIGQTVPVAVEALSQELTGTIAEILQAVDPATRTTVVKIALPDDKRLRSGMFGRAAFAGEGKERLTVPETAVVRWSQFTGVYTLDADERARLRLLRLGESRNGQVEVQSGLNSGDKIVVEGQVSLADGQKVVVTP